MQRCSPSERKPFIDEMILVASANAASKSASTPGHTSSTACSVTTCRLARAGPRHQLEIVGPDDGPVLGDEADRDAGSVAASARDPWWLVGEVAVTPLHQRKQDEAEFAALLGEPVLESLGSLVVGDALEHALGDEAVQAVGEHVARDAEAVEELVEATMAENDVADDQQRPAVADHFERASDRTDLAVVVPLQHGASIATLTCVTQVSSCTVACVKQVVRPRTAPLRPKRSRPMLTRLATFLHA